MSAFRTSPDEHPQPGGAELAELRRALDRPAAIGSRGADCWSVADLQRAATALRRVHDTNSHNFSTMLPALPRLLARAWRATYAEPGADSLRAGAALVSLYRLAALEFRHWGDLPRARVAMDRALAAAEQSGDPMLVGAVGVFTIQLMWHTEPDDAVAAAGEFAGLLARDPRAGTRDGSIVLGALHSYAALGAACAGDKTEARRLRTEAAKAAETLGRHGTLHGVLFGPAVFASDETRYLVEFGQPRDAARLGERVPLSEFFSVSRAGYHAVFLMQAYDMCGRDDAALAAVDAGLRVAPELLRGRAYAGAITRSVVSRMLRRRRHARGELRRLARELTVHE